MGRKDSPTSLGTIGSKGYEDARAREGGKGGGGWGEVRKQVQHNALRQQVGL
jgi:hypothetical protein